MNIDKLRNTNGKYKQIKQIPKRKVKKLKRRSEIKKISTKMSASGETDKASKDYK